MTQGLVRKNNLSDLPSPEQARANLGLATADYERIRGLYTSAGVSNIDVQYLAGAASNYQQQISSINSTISGIPSSIYVSKSGGTISGEWNNVGAMGATSVLISGSTISGSSDALFASDFAGGQFRITTTTLVANSGLTVQRFVSSGNVVTATGVMIDTEIPIMINGAPFFIEAGSWPSLDLRFAETKSLNDVITGQNLVSFTRASTGTYVGSDGLIKTAATNEPRFDHNPTTGESLGLLVEEQRTNLLLRSEEFDNASWAPQGTAPTITANTFTAPNGTVTADRIVFAAGGTSRWTALAPITSGVTYTITLYARSVAATLNKFRLALFDQAVQNISADFTASSTQWQRFSFSFTSTVTTPFGYLQIGNASDNAANDLYLWGAQLEAGSFPTSYIPTTSAAVTRSADVASITGTNFSSWYRQDEGTMFSDATVSYTVPGSVFPVVVGLNDGTTNNKIINGYLTSAVAGFEVSTGGVSQAGIYQSTAAANRKLANCYRLNDFAASVNGGTVGTDTSGTVPTINRLGINAVNGYNALNGTIKRLTYWPQRLPNSTLQAITQ